MYILKIFFFYYILYICSPLALSTSHTRVCASSLKFDLMFLFFSEIVFLFYFKCRFCYRQGINFYSSGFSSSASDAQKSTPKKRLGEVSAASRAVEKREKEREREKKKNKMANTSVTPSKKTNIIKNHSERRRPKNNNTP